MSDHVALQACPLCCVELGARGFRILKGYERDHLVACRGCGFIFSLLAPNQADYDRIYGGYDRAGTDERITAHDVSNRADLARRLAGDRRHGRVIDIAAGTGLILQQFAELGWTCEATEFSAASCDYLERKGFKTYPGLEAAGAPEGAYDLAVFTEVIEHINNPVPVLERIHALLRDGGTVYITTPNFNSLERRLFKSEWGMICWPEHITYWTQSHLDRALRNAGFRRRSLRTYNISVYRVVQALKKGRLAAVVGGASEQALSDRAQAAVSGGSAMRHVKSAVNAGLRMTRLGAGIEAIYEKIPARA